MRTEYFFGGSMDSGEQVKVDRTQRGVLVVDDYPIEREGLRRLIEAEYDLYICGELETALDMERAVQDLRPDVVLLAISLKDGKRLDLLRELRSQHPTLPILVLSTHDEDTFVEMAISAGASGYLTKQTASEQIVVALRQVLTGAICVSDAVRGDIIRRIASGQLQNPGNPVDHLSARELSILRATGQGLTTRATAELLNISVKTVESHGQHIRRKLNFNSRSQFVHFAINWLADETLNQKNQRDAADN